MIRAKHKDLTVELVRLIPEGVNINAALNGEALITSRTPDWLNDAAAAGIISVSKQEGSSKTHLWLDQGDRQSLVRPGDWLAMYLIKGVPTIYSFSNEMKEMIFEEKYNEQ